MAYVGWSIGLVPTVSHLLTQLYWKQMYNTIDRENFAVKIISRLRLTVNIQHTKKLCNVKQQISVRMSTPPEVNVQSTTGASDTWLSRYLVVD